MSEIFLDMLDEIEKSLKNKCYLAALGLALTIPDICGKAEYPQEKSVGTRYITWYDENIGQFEKSDEPGWIEMPYMSGELIYSLRNSFLHQGTPNIATEKIRSERCKVDSFILTIESFNNAGFSSVEQTSDGTVTRRKLEINIVNLCWKIVAVAKTYYNENKEKFNFFDYIIKYC